MLPHADDPPAGRAQGRVYLAVTIFVSLNFLGPKLGVGLWLASMVGAAVPETAVHKQRDFAFSKYKVGFSKEMLPSAPSRDAICPEKCDYSQFSPFVFIRPNPSHHFGTFRFCKNIGHWESGTCTCWASLALGLRKDCNSDTSLAQAQDGIR